MLKELNLQEMNEVKGGFTSVEQYCATLEFLIEHNEHRWTQQEIENAYTAWDTHCWGLGSGN